MCLQAALACGFAGQPRLLRQRGDGAVAPTRLAAHLKETRPALLVAAAVALHENSQMHLEEADSFFKVGLR